MASYYANSIFPRRYQIFIYFLSDSSYYHTSLNYQVSSKNVHDKLDEKKKNNNKKQKKKKKKKKKRKANKQFKNNSPLQELLYTPF